MRLLEMNEASLCLMFVYKTQLSKFNRVLAISQSKKRSQTTVSCVSARLGLYPHAFDLGGYLGRLCHGPKLIFKVKTDAHEQMQLRKSEFCFVLVWDFLYGGIFGGVIQRDLVTKLLSL